MTFKAPAIMLCTTVLFSAGTSCALGSEVSVGQTVWLGPGTSVVNLGPVASSGLPTVRVNGPAQSVAQTFTVLSITSWFANNESIDPLSAYIYSAFRGGSIQAIPVNVGGFASVSISQTDWTSSDANARLLAEAIRASYLPTSGSTAVPISLVGGPVGPPNSTSIGTLADGSGDEGSDSGSGFDPSLNSAVSAFRSVMLMRMESDTLSGLWNGIGNVRVARLGITGVPSGSDDIVSALVLVPAPVSLMLGGTGLGGLAGFSMLRRRRTKATA